MGALLGGGQEALVAGVPVAQRETVHRPALPTAPARAGAVALAAGVIQILACLGVEDEDVVAASVGPNDVLLGCFCVGEGDVSETRVITLVGRPIEERNVHDAVDDHPAAYLISCPWGVVPGPDVPAHRVIPPRQEISRMETAVLCLLAAGLAVVCHGHGEEQESDVVIQTLKSRQDLLHALLDALCGSAVEFLTCSVIHLPQHSGPEAVGPEIESSGFG